MLTLIRNGKIYDGTGAEPFIGDVLMKDDKIIKIAPSIDENTEKPDKIADVKGLSVAPGFIDAHSHNDWFAIKREPLKYFAPFIKQGITSFVTGNCGLSAVGFDADTPYKDKMGGGLFSFKDVTGKYGSVKQYFDAIDRNTPCNIATLVGHCSARASVTGYQGRLLTSAEDKEMQRILESAMDEGACGVSLGMMYEPGVYADTAELKRVADLCIKHNKPLTVHARASSKVSMAYKELFGRSHMLRALDELVEIANGTKLKLHYSHGIFTGSKTWGDADEFMEIFRQMRRDGVDAMYDIFDEVTGVSVITTILPDWYLSLSAEDKKKKSVLRKLNFLCAASSKLLGFGFKDIYIAYLGKPGLEDYQGKSVHQIAKEKGMSDFNTYMYLCELSDFKGRVLMMKNTTYDIISKQSKEPHVLYMTDSWVEDFGMQYPGVYDCFPKFLRDSLLGKGDTMPNTIRKMSGATADRFSLDKRGYLKEGYFADVTVFNENELKAATPDQTHSFGISRVFINGKEILENDELDEKTLKTSGRAMRVFKAN